MVQNERAKLSANYLNGVAISLAAVGGIAPWIAFIQGAVGRPIVVGLSSVVCVLISIGLHLVARVLLGRLSEP